MPTTFPVSEEWTVTTTNGALVARLHGTSSTSWRWEVRDKQGARLASGVAKQERHARDRIVAFVHSTEPGIGVSA